LIGRGERRGRTRRGGAVPLDRGKGALQREKRTMRKRGATFSILFTEGKVSRRRKSEKTSSARAERRVTEWDMRR